MTDILFPPGLVPRRVTWTLERSIAAFESPLSFASQRIARAGARWRASIEMPPLNAEETGLLSGYLDAIGRADHCGLLPVFQNTQTAASGGAVHGELFPAFRDPALIPSLTSANLLFQPYLLDRDLVFGAAGGVSVGSEARVARSFTVVANVPHLLTVDVPPQFNPGGWAETSAGLFSRNPPPGAGRFHNVFTPTASSINLSFYAGNGAQGFVRSRFRQASLQRPFLVTAGAAAGVSSFNGWGAGSGFSPRVTTHQAGQFFNVETSAGWELKRLVDSVDMIGANTINGVSVLHLGRFYFEPALRGVAVGNAPMNHTQPVCRMRLAEPNSSATIDAPLFGGFAFDLVEWFGA